MFDLERLGRADARKSVNRLPRASHPRNSRRPVPTPGSMRSSSAGLFGSRQERNR
jgi:hypothetical protein